MTYGEAYRPAMGITEQAEADAYFEVLVADCMEHGHTRERAEEIERSNLAYFAGYYDNETRERVERLFKCKHPVFGSIAENGEPSDEEVLMLGIAMGNPDVQQVHETNGRKEEG